MATLTTTSLSHLKFRHLMLIGYLSEFGTLHKAAKALNISQPAATAMLNDLEALLGLKLFERSHRGVKPTELGRQALGGLGTLLNEYHHFAESLHQMAHGRHRVLRVGLVPQAFATHLPQVIRQFRATQVCAIRAQEGTAAQLLGLLEDGHLDCVIGRLPSSGLTKQWSSSVLLFEPLYTESICIVCGQKTPASMPFEPFKSFKSLQRSQPSQRSQRSQPLQPTQPSFEWLASQQWVLQRPDSSVRQALNEAFLRFGVTPPTPIVETSNYMQSLALVTNSEFFTVAPRGAAELTAELKHASGALQVLDIDLGVVPMQVSFIHRAASQDDAQLQAFKACFKQVVSERVPADGARS